MQSIKYKRGEIAVFLERNFNSWTVHLEVRYSNNYCNFQSRIRIALAGNQNPAKFSRIWKESRKAYKRKQIVRKLFGTATRPHGAIWSPFQ